MSTRTLALAALTALSLGMGTAMAQEGPIVENPTDWAADPLVQNNQQGHVVATQHVVTQTGPQSGSSDVPNNPYLVNGMDGVSAGGG